MYGSRRQKISIQPTQKVTGNSRGSQKLKLLKPGEYIILYEAKLGFPSGWVEGTGGGGGGRRLQTRKPTMCTCTIGGMV